jgi:hypothetical protein
MATAGVPALTEKETTNSKNQKKYITTTLQIVPDVSIHAWSEMLDSFFVRDEVFCRRVISDNASIVDTQHTENQSRYQTGAIFPMLHTNTNTKHQNATQKMTLEKNKTI